MRKRKKLNEKTRFNKIIRIDKKQLDWLKENKDTKTIAGYLDKIINAYKRDYKKQNSKEI